MTRLVTSNFKVNAAIQLKESITETDGNDYYVFAGRHLAWDNDASPPDVSETIDTEHYEVYRNMVLGKKVTDSDVFHAVRRVDWASGTVYTQYDDTADISANNYYVLVDDIDGQRSYFKCLNNNKGAASTQMPTIQDLGGAAGAASYTNIYQTTQDGYVWKYMGGITDSTFNRFATSEFTPVSIDTTVANNAVDGSIDTVIVSSGGSEYNSYHTGYFRVVAYEGDQTKFILSADANANNEFYENQDIYIAATGEIRTIENYRVVAANTNASTSSVEYSGFKEITLNSAFTTLPSLANEYQILPKVTITGDGSNAIARAVVNTTANTIDQVIMVNRGSGYSFADITVVGNTGAANAVSANVRAIISPPGGHGSDVLNELDGSQLIFSVKIANTETNSISINNEIRQVGILKDPLFANVKMTFTGSYSIASFTDGYFVKGNTSGATGEVSDNTNGSYLVIKDVAGTFEGGETVTEYTSNTYASASGITATLDDADSQGQSSSGYLNGTFRQTTRVLFSGGFTSGSEGEFQEDDYVKMVSDTETITANGYVQEVDSAPTQLYVDITNKRGLWQATGGGGQVTREIQLVAPTGGRNPIAEIDGIIDPDLKTNSGEVLYIENIQPIERAVNQTETINLVIKF